MRTSSWSDANSVMSLLSEEDTTVESGFALDSTWMLLCLSVSIENILPL